MAELADSAFAEALASYPDLELAWLQSLYDEKAKTVKNLSIDFMQLCLNWNAEVGLFSCFQTLERFEDSGKVVVAGTCDQMNSTFCPVIAFGLVYCLSFWKGLPEALTVCQ